VIAALAIGIGAVIGTLVGGYLALVGVCLYIAACAAAFFGVCWLFIEFLKILIT
jgi:hypothetical protein